jgi:acetylornithine deacetylase/succinyl-diaminopimelate desuccinylase-like protein
LSVDYVKIKGTPPVLFLEVPASNEEQKATMLFYGHWDKQPPLTDLWDEGLGPHKPVIKDGKLYGRGGADDGYSIFAIVTAIKMIQQQKLPHSRIVFLMESQEESGSDDILSYMSLLKDRIGNHVKVIGIIDSGCGNYD